MGDDLTGKVIDTVSPPSGLEFTSVKGTADDRTFVVEAAVSTPPYGAPPYTWYLLRIAPGTAHPHQLTKLAIKLPGSRTMVLAYAPSPDGREMAVESTPDITGAVTTLGIYSVSTGAWLHAWAASAKKMAPEPPVFTLDWTDGGRQLVFTAGTGPGQSVQLRTLGVTDPVADLIAGSRALLTPGSSGCVSPQTIPDGGTVICVDEAVAAGSGSNAGCANGALKFVAFALPISRQSGRVLYQYRGECQSSEAYTLWTDASASSVIGVINTTSAAGKQVHQVGVITGGRFRPLNIAKSFTPADYPDLAF